MKLSKLEEEEAGRVGNYSEAGAACIAMGNQARKMGNATVRMVWPGGYCSPRQRVPFNLRGRPPCRPASSDPPFEPGTRTPAPPYLP